MLTTQPSGYQPQDPHLGFQSHLPIDFSPAAALGTTTTTDFYEVGSAGVLRLTLAVTAVSGTSPTLDVTIQQSSDGSTWYTCGTFTQKTAAATEQKVFATDRYIRAVQTIGGSATPTVTFTLKGFAVRR